MRPHALAMPIGLAILAGCGGDPGAVTPTVSTARSPWVVVYQTDATGNGDLVAVDPDHPSTTWPVASTDAVEFAPRFVPGTGTLIHAFDDGDGVALIALGRDGHAEFRMANPAGEEVPDWSPDGTRAVWPWGEPGTRDLVVSRADGSNPVQIVLHHGDEKQPRFSPDGTRVLYVSNLAGNEDVWVADLAADGRLTGEPRNLTAHPALEGHPAWFPDGRVLFYRYQDGDADLYVLNPETGATTNLTATPNHDLIGSVSPDGTRIAFGSARADGNWDVYVMDADGTDVVRLTDQPGFDGDPRWIPRSFVEPQEAP